MDWNKLLSQERLRSTTREISPLDLRNEFESDYGRIVFSPALRRMHDKTQVFPLTTDDNIHTRLTHSLEVSSLANSLGLNLCCNKDFIGRINYDNKTEIIRVIPVILSSISLCHDIGNPPFGHYGEDVIVKYFENYFKKNNTALSKNEMLDFTKFNGNAQGFRILSKQQILQDEFGLNLTYASLCSFLKYPNLSNEITDWGYKKKLGVFQSEKKRLEDIRKVTGLGNIRHPLAYLVEAADTISYLVMDIEDGFNKGLYRNKDFYDFMLEFGNDKVKNIFNEFIIKKYITLDSFNKERTAIVKLRIKLIQIQITHSIDKFLENYDAINQGSYAKELVFDDDENGLAKTLKKFIESKIFTHREIQSLELTGCSVMNGLLDHFVPEFIDSPSSKRSEKLYNIISNSLRNLIELETNKKDLGEIGNYYKLRLIVDYISGMTDKFALSLYQKLQGIKI